MPRRDLARRGGAARSRAAYDLGCNGVGLLPSIAGGARIAAGDAPPPGAFDPS